MTREDHIIKFRNDAVHEVLSSGEYDRYKEALEFSFELRFLRQQALMTISNIREWIKDQIGACRHSLPQDAACPD